MASSFEIVESEDSDENTAQKADADERTPNTDATPLSASEMAYMLIQQQKTNIWFGKMLGTAMKMIARVGDVFETMEVDGAALQQIQLSREYVFPIERAVESLIEDGTIDGAVFQSLGNRAEILNKIADTEKRNRNQLLDKQADKENQRQRNSKRQVTEELRDDDESASVTFQVTAVGATQNANGNSAADAFLMGIEGDSAMRYSGYEPTRGFIVDTNGMCSIVGTLLAYRFENADGTFVCCAFAGEALRVPPDYVALAKSVVNKHGAPSVIRRSATLLGESMAEVWLAMLRKFTDGLNKPIILPRWPMEKFTSTVTFDEVVNSREALLGSLIRFYAAIAPMDVTERQKIQGVQRAVAVIESERLHWSLPSFVKRSRNAVEEADDAVRTSMKKKRKKKN